MPILCCRFHTASKVHLCLLGVCGLLQYLLTELSLNAVWEMHGAGTAAAAGCMHVLVCLHAFCRSLGSFIKLRAQVPLCC